MEGASASTAREGWGSRSGWEEDGRGKERAPTPSSPRRGSARLARQGTWRHSPAHPQGEDGRSSRVPPSGEGVPTSAVPPRHLPPPPSPLLRLASPLAANVPGTRVPSASRGWHPAAVTAVACRHVPPTARRQSAGGGGAGGGSRCRGGGRPLPFDIPHSLPCVRPRPRPPPAHLPTPSPRSPLQPPAAHRGSAGRPSPAAVALPPQTPCGSGRGTRPPRPRARQG